MDQNQENQIEVYENDIELYAQLFCEENKIEDLRAASQAVFNSCLYYIYKNVFKNNIDLKDNNIYKLNNNNIPTNNNKYNYELINNILDIYIYNLCLKYDKEVSIIGFSTLTGIDRYTIQLWAHDEKSSPLRFDIYKKLIDFNEESLSDKLATGNKNPVGIIAILNRRHGWASPYTSDSNRQKNTSLSAAELPKLNQNAVDMVQIEQKDEP